MTEAATRTCYRHPDTPAGVICQRCDRPICPRCMNQASVGFQCPECVKKMGTKVVRGPAAMGGAFNPVVTITLIALNVAIWAGGQVAGSGGNPFDTGNAWTARGGLLADGLLFSGHGVAQHRIGVLHGEWWRVISAGFLHQGVIHLGMNMWALWVLGRLTERVFGRARFAAVYGVALVAGSFGAMLVSPNTLTIGASGAIYGLMGALLVIAKSRGIRVADTGLLGVLVINLFITFGIPHISIGGHLGGLVGGAAAGALVVLLPERLRAVSKQVQQVGPLLACAVLAVVLVLGSVQAAHRSTVRVDCIYAAHPESQLAPGPGCY